MINKQDELKQLYQRQSIKPIEKHISKPINERQRLAKNRVVETTKRLPKVKMLANAPSSLDCSYSTSRVDLHNNMDTSKMFTNVSSQMLLQSNHPYNADQITSGRDLPNTELLNVASSASLGMRNNVLEIDDSQARKIDRINSLTSFIDEEVKSKHVGNLYSSVSVSEYKDKVGSKADLTSNNGPVQRKSLINVFSSNSINQLS